jgi:hypothetical protein
MDFEIDCPNNHNQTVSFTQESFEGFVKSGAVFHCNTCDTDWSASKEDMARMRKTLATTTR